jgi:hypothetical protein
MKCEKAVTINREPYGSIRLAVTDAESFQDCDADLLAEAMRIDPSVGDIVKRMLGKQASA